MIPTNPSQQVPSMTQPQQVQKPMQAPQQPQADASHLLSMHMNNFLSSPEGQQLNDTLNKDKFPELHNAIQAQTKVHKMVLRHFAKLGSPAARSATDPGTGSPGQAPGTPNIPGML